MNREGKIKKKKKGTVFVGLSGGVDSAVAAALLQREGYKIVGVFMRTWHPAFLPCNEEEERRDAMRVAARLGIPFLTFDFEKEYKKEVADYMLREYRAGRTPNPDVMCNKEIKFGAFLRKAVLLGADFVATGHYAQNKEVSKRASSYLASSKFSLSRGADPAKDQSYFLWMLTQKELGKILFPVGAIKKPEVRKIAASFGLSVSKKKDSQGICFLGEVDLKEFLAHYIKARQGTVLNEKGDAIGFHAGAVFYTLGERHGFVITQKTPHDDRYYVIAKDIKKNTITVSSEKKSAETGSTFLELQNTNWILLPKSGGKYHAQIRYHGKILPCRISLMKKGTARIEFSEPVLAAPGQSCVLYDGEICLGGGIIL